MYIQIETPWGRMSPNVQIHPEIGWVLQSQAGAVSEGSAYDTATYRAEMSAAERTENERLVRLGLIDATLASDGWWWRIVKPYQYGLPEPESL